MTVFHLLSHNYWMFTKLSSAARELGVSEKFLRQLVAQKRIPFYKLSPRTLRVDLDELRDYMRLIANGENEDESVNKGRDVG